MIPPRTPEVATIRNNPLYATISDKTKHLCHEAVRTHLARYAAPEVLTKTEPADPFDHDIAADRDRTSRIDQAHPRTPAPPLHDGMEEPEPRPYPQPPLMAIPAQVEVASYAYAQNRYWHDPDPKPES